MKPTRASLILFLGFAIIFLLSVAVYPVMAADPAKTQLDTLNITDIPAQPVGAGENNPVNVMVSNTTEVMDPEDRTKMPGTGISATTQPVTEATTNVSVTGKGSSPSVAPEVTVAETGTQVPVTVTPTNVQVTEIPAESLANETFEPSPAESEPGYYSAAEQAMQSERSWGSTVSPASQDITPLWSNFRAKFSSPPAIADGIVYISSNDDGPFHEDGEYFTYVLDLHTGRFKQYLWGTGNDGRGGPTVDNGMVFVGNSNHLFYGYKPGTPGKLITMWMFPIGSSVTTRPIVMNGVVYFSDYNKIYAITEGTGKEQWSYDSCGPSCSAPQGANGVVYFSDNTKIYALDAITGERIQNFAPDPIEFPTSLVLVNGVLYYGSGQNLYAIDATTGKKIWSFNTNGPIYHKPTVANGVVYIASDTHNFLAVNATTGQKIWKITKDFDVYTISAVADDVVYFGCEHDLWAVNAADGRTLWKYNFGDAWVGSPAIADGILVVGTDPGPVYAFDVSNTGLSGTPRSGNAPLTVQFTDTTAGSPTSWNWQFGDGGASSLQNPTHVYTAPGNYRVTLVTSGPTGSHTTVRDDYITVTGATSSNIAVFGNTQAITTWPSGTDYTRLGGLSAIRRNGTLETFVPAPNLPGTDWVMVTNGAAIKTDGTLVTWTPGSTTPVWNPSGTGKKYVAVSQHRDWLLAIYEDPAGLTHLETLANPAAPPASVSGNVPTGTGWKMIAAGNNHALALRTDGTLVAWGDNAYGQRNLPTTTTYHDIEAGDDFSIGLDPASAILTAGKDDAGQVSGKPAGTGYMAIDVGTATGAALTKNGTVVQWGQTMPGSPPPSDTGYTDVMLGPDYGFALRESVKEAAVTEPLSPDQSVRALDGTDVYIPMGASFDHTHNDVTRVFDQNGKQILWANDENATQVIFPAGAKLPISLIHKVPSGSAVDGTVPYHATVSKPGSIPGNAGDVMSVSEDAWYDEVNPTLPRAMCFAGKGCSAGVTAKQQLFLSEPLAPTRGGIPVFSVRQTDNNTWVGTLSIRGSTNPADSTSMIMEKNNIDPDQAINFSIISGKWGNGTGTNVVLSAKANLTSENAVLQYSGVATASQQLKSMAITPRIWKQGSTEDVLVYTGNPTTCANTKECRLNGTFIPVWDISNVTATYFANVTTDYKLSNEMLAANGDNPGECETIYETHDNIPVPEVVVTEPLSPLEPGKIADAANANNTVPWGGTIEHVMDGDVPMTVVYYANGQPKFQADDNMATKIAVPGNDRLPATNVYATTLESTIDSTTQQNIVVTDPQQLVTEFTVKSPGLVAGSSPPSTSGVYYMDKKGGTVVTSVGNNVFMSPAIPQNSEGSGTESPSFKYMWRDFGNGSGGRILCNGYGANTVCTDQVTNDITSTRTVSAHSGKLDLAIMSSSTSDKGSTNQPLNLSAEATAVKDGNVIHYTFTTSSTQNLPQINITPMVFTNAMENRSAVYRGSDMMCLNTDRCTVSGDYTMDAPGDYFAHGYINVTIPDSFAGSGSPKNFYVLPDSGIITSTQLSGMQIGDASTAQIKQVENYDIYLWGLVSEHQNRTETGNSGPVNVVLLNQNPTLFMAYLKEASGGKWGYTGGSAGNGYRGKSENAMEWTSVGFNTWDHVAKGNFIAGEKTGGRYHCPIFNGGHSETLKGGWIFSYCHHENFVCPNPVQSILDVSSKDCTHVSTEHGANEGRAEFMADLELYSMIKPNYGQVYFEHPEGNYADGYAWVATAK